MKGKNVKKIRVGLDVDGTLAHSQEAIVNAYNLRTNGNHTKEELDSHTGWSMPITDEEFSELHYTLWKDDWERIRPAVSERTLSKLISACDVQLLTGIPEACDGGLRSWLGSNFPNTDVKIRYVVSLREKPYLGYDVLFDDADPVADEFLKVPVNGMKLYLIDQPWNKRRRYEEESSRITRVESLSYGIESLLSELQRV
jgi:5'(3')-deoxyribonucleotidase